MIMMITKIIITINMIIILIMMIVIILISIIILKITIKSFGGKDICRGTNSKREQNCQEADHLS